MGCRWQPPWLPASPGPRHTSCSPGIQATHHCDSSAVLSKNASTSDETYFGMIHKNTSESASLCPMLPNPLKYSLSPMMCSNQPKASQTPLCGCSYQKSRTVQYRLAHCHQRSRKCNQNRNPSLSASHSPRLPQPSNYRRARSSAALHIGCRPSKAEYDPQVCHIAQRFDHVHRPLSTGESVLRVECWKPIDMIHLPV